MADAPAAPTEVPTQPSPVPTPEVKSGLKTTELYVVVLAMGGLLYCLQELVSMLPSIAATPGIPGWAAALLGVVPIGLGYVIKLLAVKYAALRTQLKLGPTVDGQVVSSVTTPQAAVAAINK